MRLVRPLFALLLVPFVVAPSAAQRASDTRRARPVDTNVVPYYPDVMRMDGLGGVVRVTFAVDSSGRPIMASFVVRATENDRLIAPVKAAVRQWRFVPARRGGHAATDSIEQVVEFLPPRPEFVLALPPAVLARDSLGPGRWRLAVGVAPMAETAEPVAESLHVAIASAALDMLLAMLPVDARYPPRIACVALKTSGALVDPPLSLLRALSRPSYTVVAARRCPPTFGAPFRPMLADGRLAPPDPPGEDPWAFTPLAPRAVDDSTALIDVAMSHGTIFGTYHCFARRDRTRPGGWKAVCQAGRMGVS